MAWGVCLAGDYAYVADGQAGLQVVSIADLENPRIVGNIGIPGTALAVTMLNDLVVVAGLAGVSVISVDSPQRPTILHSMVFADGVRDVAVAGETIYLAHDRQGVAVVQFDSRQGLRLLQVQATCGPAQSVSVSGEQLLVGCGKKGVEVFAVEHSGLRSLEVVDTPGNAIGVAAAEGRIYVADSMCGLHLVERGPTSALEIVKTIDTPGTAWGVTLANG
jgi:hypothetical protein